MIGLRLLMLCWESDSTRAGALRPRAPTTNASNDILATTRATLATSSTTVHFMLRLDVRLIRLLGFLLIVLLVSGCAFTREAKVPMDSILSQRAATQSKTLIVFLPGSQEVPQDVVNEGFVAQVRAKHIDADVMVIDSHLGYFRNRTFDVRIHDDIIEPARKKGYASIWLAGISLGGFGSLMYAFTYPNEIDGIIALAPFVASDKVLDEVVDAGGLARWTPTEPLGADDYERALLKWLKGYSGPQNAAEKRPKLYIGYGVDDRMARFQPIIGTILPAEQMLAAPGGHDWPPWKQIWEDALGRAPLPKVKNP